MYHFVICKLGQLLPPLDAHRLQFGLYPVFDHHGSDLGPILPGLEGSSSLQSPPPVADAPSESSLITRRRYTEASDRRYTEASDGSYTEASDRRYTEALLRGSQFEWYSLIEQAKEAQV